MKKRIKAVFLAVVMVLSVALGTFPAAAAGTVIVSEVSGVQGELVDVQITLTSDDVCSGNFNVCYDSSALELVDTISTELFQCLSNPYEPGSVRVSFMRVQPITEALLCTLTFRVTADTSDEGNSVTLERVKLYNKDGSLVPSSVIEGAVVRKTVRLSMRVSETAEYQAVRAIVDLGGSLSPAGGNFSVVYDPTHFTVTSVVPLEAMDQASCEYHIVKPGLVRVAFSSAVALDGGALCGLVFQTVGSAGASSELTITDVKMYDEDSEPLDVSVVHGSLSIVVPSDDDPKLWVVGGAAQDDGTARSAVVLQGRGYACGGNFVLHYDPAMTATVEADDACQVNHDGETGTVMVSWAAATAYSAEAELLTISFENAVESTVEIENVTVYYDEGKTIPVVNVRPGQISKTTAVTAVVDEVVVETAAAVSSYTVTVDVADMNYFEEAAQSVTTALALYEKGRLVGIAMQAASDFRNGTSEIELKAETNREVTNVNVFLMDSVDSLLPLREALNVAME